MATKQPNILVIWGDDIGWFNVSAYNHGVMGYRTPNIDRIAKEGAMFTDWYGQQSCTAGRAAFITGQSPIRTGLTKVGLPGADQGLRAHDPTIAELLKPLGYVTGQFGKNHLGDRNEFLPTAHGFDEFFGNLYHLNAEEEPENPDYPKDPEFKKRFGPRGVMHCWATDKDDPTEDPVFGRVGKQRIENTGPLTTKRMETVNDEFTDAALDFIDRAHKASKPFFVWSNSTRMHIFTHLKPASIGKTGLGTYPDGMVEHDGDVGRLLDKLDELGIADNTIVMYSTDNGAEEFSWPDGGTTPFRGEKDTNWEAGWRVPTLLRWPGVIKPGTVSNEICAHEDMLPTLLAAAGVPDVKETAAQGVQGRATRPSRSTSTATTCCPILKGEVEGVAAQGDALLERRRRSDGAALRQLEGGLQGAARGELPGLVGADGRAARAEDLQPAQRSVREGGQELHLLQRLAGPARLPARAGPGLRGPLDPELQGLPAEPEAGKLQHRPGHGEADGSRPEEPLVHGHR